MLRDLTVHSKKGNKSSSWKVSQLVHMYSKKTCVGRQVLSRSHSGFLSDPTQNWILLPSYEDLSIFLPGLSQYYMNLAYMGTFAETAIVAYHFHFLAKENKCLLSISVCSKQMEVCRFRFLLQKTTEVAVFR